MESYWITDTKGYENTKQLFDFLQQQIELLYKQTNGNVVAKNEFSRYAKYEQLQQTIDAFSSAVALAAEGKKAEKDATILYQNKRYEFYITDKHNKYELAIFQYTCNDLFPIQLNVDSDIAREAELDLSYIVDNMMQFKSLFKQIIQTKKVIYIIDHLNKMIANE